MSRAISRERPEIALAGKTAVLEGCVNDVALVVIILFHGNSSIRAVQFTSQANCQAAAGAITDHIADMVGYKPPAGKESNPYDDKLDKLELRAKLGIDVLCTPQ